MVVCVMPICLIGIFYIINEIFKNLKDINLDYQIHSLLTIQLNRSRNDIEGYGMDICFLNPLYSSQRRNR